MKLKNLVTIIPILLFCGCGLFSGDEKKVGEVLNTDKVKTTVDSANQISKSKDTPEEKAEKKNESKDEKSEEGGFFASITSILPMSSTSKDIRKSEDSTLQVARLIARVEELTTHIIKMQSRLLVLEKSVHLGISPESLNSQIVADSGNRAVRNLNQNLDQEIEESIYQVLKDGGKNDRERISGEQVKSSQFDDFQKDLNKAISLFKKGEYGSAYVSFTNINSTYTENVKQGLPDYWIARSWYRLREFPSAKKYFQSYIRKYPTSIQTPMAKYYLAKIDVAMGMPGSAIALLQEVIREHPTGSAAEASRKLIGEMNRSL